MTRSTTSVPSGPPRPRRWSRPWPTSGRRAATISAGSCHDHGNPCLPAQGAGDHDSRGQDRLRLELSQPAPFRPDRRGPERGAGLARRPDGRPDRRAESRSRRQTGPPARVKAKNKETERTSRRTARKPWRAPAWQRPSARARARARPCGWADPRNAFNNLFGIDPSIPIDDVMGTIPQALFLMNGPMIHNRTQARPGTVLGEILMTTPTIGPH